MPRIHVHVVEHDGEDRTRLGPVGEDAGRVGAAGGDALEIDDLKLLDLLRPPILENLEVVAQPVRCQWPRLPE